MKTETDDEMMTRIFGNPEVERTERDPAVQAAINKRLKEKFEAMNRHIAESNRKARRKILIGFFQLAVVAAIGLTLGVFITRAMTGAAYDISNPQTEF